MRQGTASRASVLVALLSSLVVPAMSWGVQDRLPPHFARVPYNLIDVVSRGRPALEVLAVDLDGDGAQEIVASRRSQSGAVYYIMISRPSEGAWTPLEQISSPGPLRLAGAIDVNLDGVPEILRAAQTSTTLSLDVLSVRAVGDSSRSKSLGGISWDIGECRYGAAWDGHVEGWGALDGDGDGIQETLLFTIAGGMSRRPRGVGAGDWTTGEILWFIPTAAAPTSLAILADLTGDARPEIVVPMGAPSNGVSEGGTDDSHSYVAAITADGRVLWMREVGGASSAPAVAVADLDGDGVAEVVSALHRGKPSDTDHPALSVLRSGDGEPIAEWGPYRSIYGLCVVESPEGPRIMVGCSDGLLGRLSLSGTELHVEGTIDCGSSVCAVGSLVLDTFPEPVLTIVTGSGMIAVLDLDLTPLAALPTNHGGLEGKGVEPIVLPGGERAAFVRTNDALCGLVVERAPRSPWPWAVLVLLATIGTVTGVPRARRRISSSIRRALIPAADRESVLDDVLVELSTAGHGKLAVTATIRRMRDQLTMLSGLDKPPPQQFGERLREAVQNVRDVGLPKALAIAGNVEGVGITPDRVTSLRRGIRAVSELTRALPAGVPYGRAAGTLARGLDEATDLVETSLKAIKAACRYEMSCEVVAEIRRAVGARRSEMIERGIELVAPAVSRLEGSRVFGTSTEVSFILENLIANAIQAIGESAAGRISISAESADGTVVVAVTDTGKGIPTADRERIFERGFSQNPGGGHGLWRSRDILVSREGSIQLVDSTPGRGSRFEVRFAPCER